MNATIALPAMSIKAGQQWRTERGYAVKIICGPTGADDDAPNVYPITGAYIGLRVNGRLGQQFNKYGASPDGDKLAELIP